MDEKYTELAVHLQEISSRSQSNEHRICALEDTLDKLQETQIALIKIANSVENMGQSIITIKDDVSEVKSSQKELTEKVSEMETKAAIDTKKRLDTIFETGLKIISAGIITAALLSLFPGIPW
ncbi:MAG: hypothetical protein ACI4EQ_00330 [Lachnospiraceae bacterium]